jgi:hypothetical protein
MSIQISLPALDIALQIVADLIPEDARKIETAFHQKKLNLEQFLNMKSAVS